MEIEMILTPSVFSASKSAEEKSTVLVVIL
ncbi:hypothetical protein HNQ42_002310 [Rummeliibacillus stabekisii]|nr:hypothetical protein [Rummeliibacillus stabekisii]